MEGLFWGHNSKLCLEQIWHIFFTQGLRACSDVEGNTLERSRKLATVCGDAGKSNHKEVFAGPGAIKLKRSQDWGDCFSASSKFAWHIQIWDHDSSIMGYRK